MDKILAIVIGILAMLGMVIIPFMVAYITWFEPVNPKNNFIRETQHRCSAMRGKLTLNGKEYECWRTPFMRFPKKMFSVEYEEK